MATGRRTFLIGGASVAVTGGLGLYGWLRSRGYDVDPAAEPWGAPRREKAARLTHEPFDPKALSTLERLLDDLLPGDAGLGLPSASGASVVDFVRAAMQEGGLQSLRADVLKLLRHLDKEAKDTRGKGYEALEVDERLALLDRIATTKERHGGFRPHVALEVTLRLGLEGYLGHPFHGGNPGGVVWKALAISMPLDRGPFVSADGTRTPHSHHGGADHHQDTGPRRSAEADHANH